MGDYDFCQTSLQLELKDIALNRILEMWEMHTNFVYKTWKEETTWDTYV